MTIGLILLKNNFNKMFNKTFTTIETSPKIKGTIVEKWLKYWKQLGIDYKDVATELVKDIKSQPVKSLIYGTVGGILLYSFKNNPDGENFMHKLRFYNSQILLVHENSVRFESAEHLKQIERCINEGVLRCISLGILTLIWRADYDENIAIYKAKCPNLQIKYLTFYQRVIDIGFWNKWWVLNKKIIDYDVRT